MKSMTGFGKRQCSITDRKITIEIKTLNSKALDLIVKVPAFLHSHEIELRTMLNQLERGKVEMLVTEECDTACSNRINKALVTERYQELTTLADTLNCSDKHLFETILGMPDVWESNSNNELTDNDWDTLARTIQETIAEVDQTRTHEGGILQQDFVKHVNLIEKLLGEIPQYESERIETAKERIRKYFAETAIKEIDQNRFEQELIYYLEKLDITEEKIRLQKHIDYFRQTMDNEEGSGKKLGFIAQEMGREINTTGSKANHVEIQKIVVQMKDELEKIKEQLGNIL